ncbi:WecB/TagA/CpsF family glycosyltransferase [Devosia sp. ZB163]|uniref:WecB/TagA/CpsF family glycosyltransferase n=1 Tax=Devosia sp. ZB163 TaxID=3025938 RepID=UPI00236127B9|nr:WecB/TagA/CpsF family glycosyltransferase [Devosia sp. ZB163]MDC9826318.1 WecB/TagA/CpsF family glycosyltransferase [Devosia sp. ZB163]
MATDADVEASDLSGERATAASQPTVMVGGFRTAVLNRHQLAERMLADCLEARAQRQVWRPKLIFSSNGQGIALAASDSAFAAAMDEADIIHADGMPVVFASRLTSTPLPERIATTDFFHNAAQVAAEHGLRFFLLGGAEEENAAAAEAIRRQYPTLQLVGRHHGYFGPEQDEAVCRMVRDSGADVLWIALGKPMQEHWSVRNRDRLRGVGWIKTCGGLFSFLIGSARRAPQPIQDLGLEWLHRLLRDPRRLFWRYLTTNPVALYQLLFRTERSGRVGRLIDRLSMGAGAPALFALANFVALLVLQQSASAEDFGLLSFAQVVVATGIGLSSAMFSGPALVSLSQGKEPADSVIGSFFRANLIYCVFAAVGLFGMAALAGATSIDAILLSMMGATMWVRMFVRALQLALHQRQAAARSDLAYAGTVLMGLPVVVLTTGASVASFAILQAVGTVVSILPMTPLFIRTVRAAAVTPASIFRQSFQRHGRWAIVAALANKVTAQGHSFVLTLALGPAAYAPVALATLLFRPMGVVVTGLIQFERPNMARSVAAGEAKQLASDVGFVCRTVAATWFSNVLLVGCAVALAPGLLTKDGYETGSFIPALMLVGLTVLIRALRDPQETALETAGHYRDLANLAILCGPVSVVVMLAAWAMWPTAPWGILFGGLVGEATYAMLVARRYGRLQAGLRS